MHTLFSFWLLVSFVASGYFLVKLIYSFVKGGDKKYYAKGLVIAFVVLNISSLCFRASETPEQKASQQIQRETQEKDSQQKVAQQETEKKPAEKKVNTAVPPQQNTPENKIKEKIKGYIPKYDETTLNDITVNPDLGTDKDGDYVALVRLTWNRKNSGKMSKEMLDMYSSDMAARIYEDLPEVQELAVFWTVPYLNGSAKISFERANGGMKYTDQMFDQNFNK